MEMLSQAGAEFSDRTTWAKDVYSRAAIAANSVAASVGREMLGMGGNAVDATIATLLCESLYAMQNMGLGGGTFMCIYKKEEGRAYCLDAREAAPAAAHRYMFATNTSSASAGMKSVAVPGEMMGYWEVHRKFGKLPWKQLFNPAIYMCYNGIPVSERLAKSFKALASDILSSPTISEVVAPAGKIPVEGDKLKMPVLARTLETIALSPNGAMELYRGSLADSLIADIQNHGGIITKNDLASYRAVWRRPVVESLGTHWLHTMPAPGCGHVLGLMLQLLHGLLPAPDSVTTFHLLAEASKHAYALRSHLGDPAFTHVTPVVEKLFSESYIQTTRKKMLSGMGPDSQWYGANYSGVSDHGTINVCVLDEMGDAVAATSTINTLFGGMVASPSTGIILNNQMDDFSTPRLVNSFGVTPSAANYIAPGKRPLSSMCPSIFTDEAGDVRLVIGSAGGTHITTAVAQVAMRYLWFGQTLREAVEAPRMHHQLEPMVLRYENGFSSKLIKGLQNLGHRTKLINPHSSVTAISKSGSRVSAVFDYRRGGATDGY